MKTLLHIGFPHTGNERLRRGLLEDHPEVFLVASRDAGDRRASTTRQALSRELLEPIRDQDSLDYSQRDVDSVRTELLNLRPPGQRLVVSDESFSVTFDPSTRLTDRQLVAERLATTFRDGRVLITVRSQLSILPEIHSQLARAATGRELPPYGEWVAGELANASTGVMSMLNFDRTVDLYQKVFAPSKVTVMAHESLVAHPGQFARTLADLLDIDPDLGARLFTDDASRKPRQMPAGLARAEARNERLGRAIRGLRGIAPERLKDLAQRVPVGHADQTLSPELTHAVVERFENSNRTLAAQAGLDLDALGWFSGRS